MPVRRGVPVIPLPAPDFRQQAHQSMASALVAVVAVLVPMGRLAALAEPVELLTQHHLAVTMDVVRVELLPVGMAVPGLWSVA